MSATYDSTLPSDRDWVRFLIGDVDVTPSTDAQLSDEEIDALLDEHSGAATPSVKYYSAADGLSILLTRYASNGRGLIEKTLAHAKIVRGVNQSISEAIQSRIAFLRAKADSLNTSTTTSAFFSVYGGV